MKIAVILPHLKLFGGVKRYLELGNAFINLGHQCVLYTPEKEDIPWFNYKGHIDNLMNLKNATIDVCFTSEEVFLNDLLSCSARKKIFYVISKNKVLKQIAKHKEIQFFANSTTTYQRIVKKTGIIPFKAFGGVDVSCFRNHHRPQSDETINILTYGRQINNDLKGVMIVTKACELLYKKGCKIKLFLFDTPVSDSAQRAINQYTAAVPHEFMVNHPVDKNIELFNSVHIFASAEKKGGWSNTCAEAMASGVPVIATKIGTEDFLFNGKTGIVVKRNRYSVARALKKCILSPNLRNTFSRNGLQQIQKFDWAKLAQDIVAFFSHDTRPDLSE